MNLLDAIRFASQNLIAIHHFLTLLSGRRRQSINQTMTLIVLKKPRISIYSTPNKLPIHQVSSDVILFFSYHIHFQCATSRIHLIFIGKVVFSFDIYTSLANRDVYCKLFFFSIYLYVLNSMKRLSIPLGINASQIKCSLYAWRTCVISNFHAKSRTQIINIVAIYSGFNGSC